jgi:hypothetical protein
MTVRSIPGALLSMNAIEITSKNILQTFFMIFLLMIKLM